MILWYSTKDINNIHSILQFLIIVNIFKIKLSSFILHNVYNILIPLLLINCCLPVTKIKLYTVISYLY